MVEDAPRSGFARYRYPLTLLLAILPLIGWWATGLFDLDEGFYGAVVGEMNRRHEWITPYYNGHPWFEKPILLYWVAKPFLMAFGDMVGPRLPSVLATIGTYILVGAYVKKRVSEPAAIWSVLILGSSFLVVALGRLMMTDALLSLCLTGAFLSFWESLNGDRSWRTATAVLLGLSVLAKGPVGLILFGGVAAWTFWSQPERRAAFRGWWLVGTVLLVMTTATWYWPAYMVNGQVFVQKFFVEQNLNRFTGGDDAHTVPFFPLGWLMYFLVLLVGMLPWSCWIPLAWPRKGADGFERYLAAWAAVIFLFFTVSSAKLVHYVLPCCPPLAMLVGIHLSRRPPLVDATLKKVAVGWTLVLCGIANFAQSMWYRKSGQEEAHALIREIKATNMSVALYQLSRREADKGTGTTKLRATSLPSLIMYLDRPALATDNLSDILELPKPTAIFTRHGRISEPELRAMTFRTAMPTVRKEGEHFDWIQLDEHE